MAQLISKNNVSKYCHFNCREENLVKNVGHFLKPQKVRFVQIWKYLRCALGLSVNSFYCPRCKKKLNFPKLLFLSSFFQMSVSKMFSYCCDLIGFVLFSAHWANRMSPHVRISVIVLYLKQKCQAGLAGKLLFLPSANFFVFFSGTIFLKIWISLFKVLNQCSFFFCSLQKKLPSIFLSVFVCIFF